MADEYEKIDTGNMWQPEQKEDSLIGEITEITDGNYGLQYTIRKADNEIIRTPSHKVLQNRMAGMKKGDKIKIVFIGEEAPKVRGQNPLKMYDVFKKKQ